MTFDRHQTLFAERSANLVIFCFKISFPFLRRFLKFASHRCKNRQILEVSKRSYVSFHTVAKLHPRKISNRGTGNTASAQIKNPGPINTKATGGRESEVVDFSEAPFSVESTDET